MKFGIFEIITRYNDNGVFGDGFASWPAGTSITLLTTCETAEDARSECRKLSASPFIRGRTYFFTEVFKHEP